MTDRPEPVFRLVYASRCELPDTALEAEIPRILAAARRNNAAQGVTGALLFSADGFVQVLEGPTEAVERTFERIECDPRHAHVVILEAGPAAAREFQNWSMAYAGRDADQRFAAFSRAPRTACPEALALLRAALDRMTPEQAAAA
jgi:hypothetical protein